MGNGVLISIDAVPLPDSQTFVGRVRVGDMEAYRTITGYSSFEEALHATAYLVAGFLGPRLAGLEWQAMRSEMRHAPLRRDLQTSVSPHDSEP